MATGDLYPRDAKSDPMLLDPQGAMLESQAVRAYELMQAGQLGKGFETDYPILVGQWKGMAK